MNYSDHLELQYSSCSSSSTTAGFIIALPLLDSVGRGGYINFGFFRPLDIRLVEVMSRLL